MARAQVPTGDAGKTHHELVEGGSDLITKGRLYCALLRSRKIVVAAKLRYTGPVDIVRINTLLQVGRNSWLQLSSFAHPVCALCVGVLPDTPAPLALSPSH